jgi:hypothetical protein
MDEEQLKLAYVAGAIDGEGHLGISISLTHPHMKDGLCWAPQINIANSDIRMVNFCHEVLGCGTVHTQTDPRRGNTWHFLSIHGALKVAECLRRVMPYLVTKREAAIVLHDFALRRSKPGEKKPYDEIDFELFKKLRALTHQYNHRKQTNSDRTIEILEQRFKK